MTMPMSIAAALRLCVLLVASAAAASWSEKWRYTDVRHGAHMFWWLYQGESRGGDLVIWLQGGPGASSTGFGNFGEIGPVDATLQQRRTTWLSRASLLFIDNPVGSGFSYVDNMTLLATDNDMISRDLVAVTSDFLNHNPEFETAPLWIFSESYGGKMTTGFANALYDAIARGDIKANFKGVALGDSWISPIDSVWSWTRVLKAVSLIDEKQERELDAMYSACNDAINSGDTFQATMIWGNIETAITKYADGVDFYNFMHHSSVDVVAEDNPLIHHLNRRRSYTLAQLMNGPIRDKLGIIPDHVSWGGQSENVFSSLAADFMTPVVEGVDRLLNLGVSVNVYSGQLDLIVATLGTERWMNRLTWPHLGAFQQAEKQPHSVAGVHTALFCKSYRNLAFYTVMNAGHMIPTDMPESALLLLKMITAGETPEHAAEDPDYVAVA